MNKSASLLENLDVIKNTLNGLLNPALESEIDELSGKISEEKFYLVVLGLFKRGKSSFINSLLGEIVVPSGVVPLTAIITLIEHSDEKYAEIYFKDGKKEKVRIDEVKNFIAEAKNPNNEKNVTKVIIYYPSEILKFVTIIDTPGVGSSLEHNTQTTLEFVNKIDAAVFMLSTDIPITKLEVEFLSKLKEIVPRIIFVLNKTDLLENKSLTELTDYNNQVLNEICENNFKIIQTSSKLALEGLRGNNPALIEKSNIGKVKQVIFDLLNNEKEEIFIKATKSRFIKVLNEAKSLIAFKIRTLKMPAEQLDEKLSQFQKSIEVMKTEKDEFDILMEGKIKRLQEYVEEETDKLGNILNEKIEKEFNENFIEVVAKIRELSPEEFQIEYFSAIHEDFDKLKKSLEKDVIEKFKTLLNKYGEGSNKFLSELIATLPEFTGLKFEALSDIFDLDIYTGFYYNFSAQPIPLGLNNKSIRKKMPAAVIKKTLLNKILKNFKEKIISNTASVKYDINYRIQESFLQFKFDLNNKLDSVLKSLEKILIETIEEKKKTESEVVKELALYEEKLNVLNKLG